MNKNRFPPGWDEERVRRVLDHYEQQTDGEAVAEDEARYDTVTRSHFSLWTRGDSNS